MNIVPTMLEDPDEDDDELECNPIFHSALDALLEAERAAGELINPYERTMAWSNIGIGWAILA